MTDDPSFFRLRAVTGAQKAKLGPRSRIAATLIFIGCLSLGFWIAQHKALWNDEYFSQLSSVDGTSYTAQWSGRIPEGGNPPLFYSLQKLFLQTIHYQVPIQWSQGHWSNDAVSQILLRVNPVIFMSLSVTMVFYYFCRRGSLLIGFYSLFIYISSYMLWVYWAEARPYALLVFLTTAQSMVLLDRMGQDFCANKRNSWVLLAVINMLLALTFILSVGQILAASVLWWWVFREHDWKKYVLMTALPVAVAFFYYMHAPKYQFFFGLSPEQLIRDNISRQRFDILFIYLISLSAYWGGQKKQLLEGILYKEILRPVPYVIFMVLVLASSAMVLCFFAFHAKGNQGFPVTSRYFIYLTPIGAIATTIMSVSLFGSLSRHRLIQRILMGLIGFLLAQYFLKIVPKALHSLMQG